MKQKTILISGASGFLGSALIEGAAKDGHHLILLRRPKNKSKKFPKENKIEYSDWDPYAAKMDDSALERADVIINLSGENIAAAVWTKAQKKKILDSRVIPTTFLASKLAKATNSQKVFISASALGFYGNSDRVVDESSPAGNGFLSQVCLAWEGALAPLSETGHRVVIPRFGVLLDPSGGMLQRMLLPFRLGMGTQLGSGQQQLSWISLLDTVRGLIFLAENDKISGPTNFCSPKFVSNKKFTKYLASSLNRKAIFRAPSILLRTILGEMAEELFLASIAAKPTKLLSAGFTFNDADLEKTLKAMVSK